MSMIWQQMMLHREAVTFTVQADSLWSDIDIVQKIIKLSKNPPALSKL